MIDEQSLHVFLLEIYFLFLLTLCNDIDQKRHLNKKISFLFFCKEELTSLEIFEIVDRTKAVTIGKIKIDILKARN